MAANPTPENAPRGEFDVFADGGVPELPNTAPKDVSFGVVVFTYQGAEFSNKDSRSKEEARQKALALIELARKDFASAVAKGDSGSTASAGRVPRGVLEPTVEYNLFTLAKGGVANEPIDTPRGFWILRRND